MVLFASDLDNTLIYSYKRVEGNPVWVEYKDGKQLSYMTEPAFALLQGIYDYAEFVPVTTRSLEQYQRISFFPDKAPHYALCSNGGILLKDGIPEAEWAEETQQLIAGALGELEKAIAVLKRDPDVVFEVRRVDDIFVFTKTADIVRSTQRLQAELDLEQVFIDAVGQKIYVFPKVLDKGLALNRLKKRLHPKMTVTAGDSTFDVPLLAQADEAFVPYNSPLAKMLPDTLRCHTARRQGAQYAEEILESVRQLGRIHKV